MCPASRSPGPAEGGERCWPPRPRTARSAAPRSSPPSTRTVRGTRYEALGRPRCGTGVRYGASVSTSTRSSGVTRSASRSGSAFLKVTVPAKDRQRPALHAGPGERRRRRRSSASPSASGGADVVEHPQHVVVGVAVVDHQRAVEPLGQLRRARGTTPPGRRGPRARCGSGRARSPPPPAPGRCSRPGGVPPRAPRRAGPAASSSGASLGCSATPATTWSWAAAVSHRPPRARRSQPICTTRVTPTAAASGEGVGDGERRLVAAGRCRGGSGCPRPGAAAAPAAAGRPARTSARRSATLTARCTASYTCAWVRRRAGPRRRSPACAGRPPTPRRRPGRPASPGR